LHHFYRNAASQQHDAVGGGYFGERQRAGELVQCVVAADILAQAYDTST
jgi:hypothetical protein